MKTGDIYSIHINFLPLECAVPDYEVYRRLRTSEAEDRPQPDIRCYSLPVSGADLEVRAHYWISLEPFPGAEGFRVSNQFNNQLTQWVIFKSIAEACGKTLSANDYEIYGSGFLPEVHLKFREHPEGTEELVLQPYFLRVAQQFGVLADFHFRKKPEVQFDRRVQQLSLSLDARGKRNLDFYLDKFRKIEDYLERRRGLLMNIQLPGASRGVSVSSDFYPLSANRLRARAYVFSNGREARSQFSGLREQGPLVALKESPKLVFVFRERDRQAARTLAAALKGSNQKERYGFPGFSELFKTPLEIDRNPIVLEDFSAEAMRAALERMDQESANSLAVLVMPEDEEAYLTHKAVFSHSGRPTQVVTLGVIQDDYALKWSIANIALQIFCKAGGYPWKVRPISERSLIIGVSQSHKVRSAGEKKSIDRYFAFSVLTDSSGLFQRMQVLGEGDNERDYLASLRKTLAEVVGQAKSEFSRVVIHTSFKLKHREISAIQQVIRESIGKADEPKCQFAVVKVNHKTRFFGANRNVNSLVPFEGTRVKLGHGEHLVWFEGIDADKPTVTKAFPGPTHIQFLRVDEDHAIAEEILLQDLVNLSGANWRGFNAKSAPVSVFYCHLVADLVHDFQERGLPLPAIKDLRPWFL